MSEIVAAVDETAATDVLHDAEAAVGVLSSSGSQVLGPFTASYSANASFSGGAVNLIPPGTIRLTDVRTDFTVGFTFSFDLSSILPDFCLPQVCVDIPCVGEVCIPPVAICIDWPTITIPVTHSDFVKFTGDFGLSVNLVGGQWEIDAVLLAIPSLQLGPASAAILVAIGAAATPVLLAVPFIGPFLAIAVDGILAGIALAGVTGFLGPILTPFLSGLRFNLYRQPQLFELVPSGGAIDPPVFVNLDSVTAAVQGTDEDELVVSVDVSP